MTPALDVRAALLAAARTELDAHGSSGLSLRAVARRAGVSHAAPKHHFGDRAGLLTALATEGFRDLARDQRAAGPGLLALGESYVAHAAQHPAVFELMFRARELDASDADLRAAQEESIAALHEAAGLLPARDDEDPADLVHLAWAVAHGLALLQRDGALAAVDGDPSRVLAALGRRLAPAPRPDPSSSRTSGLP